MNLGSLLFVFLFIALPDHAQPPSGSISGRTIITVGDTSILRGSPSGGTWSSANYQIATVDASGIVTGVSTGTVNIWYYPPPGSYYNSTYAIVTIKDPTFVRSIEQNIDNAIEIYPNPANASLTVSSNDKISRIIVTNLIGQTIYCSYDHNEKVQVDVSGLATGIYLVRINGTEVRKFVKQ